MAKRKKKTECPFKVGDKVRVKEWDEILKLGTLDDDGDVYIRENGCFFFSTRKELCGKEVTIKMLNIGEKRQEVVVDVRSLPFPLASIEKIESPKERDLDFKVGDRVRIRQWDDMLKEFGEKLGNIQIPTYVFNSEMKEFCGKELTISKVRVDAGDKKIKKISFKEDDLGGWTYTMHMIEKVEELPKVRDLNFKVGETVRIRSVEDMEEQFGNIDHVPYGFNEEMGAYCGREFVISGIDEDDDDDDIEETVVDLEGMEEWTWCFAMIEKIDQPVPVEKVVFEKTVEVQVGAEGRTCENCFHCQELESNGEKTGYCWCKSWYNTTIPEGYCHKFFLAPKSPK